MKLLKIPKNVWRARAFGLAFLSLCFCFFCACNSTQPTAPAQKYELTGKVESVDTANQAVVVNGNEIPGFMSAMTMSYKVKNQSDLNQLSPGDLLSAEIVKQQDDYWLENVKVTQHSSPAKSPVK